jgi:hypothetical protein
MNLCAAVVTLALNATLLGQPSLKIAAFNDAPVARGSACTVQNEAANPNAVISLRDASGGVVFSQKIRVAGFDFYLSGKKRGGVPARDAVVFVNYPKTDATERATVVELATIGFPYRQSARLPAHRETAKAKTELKLSLK